MKDAEFWELENAIANAPRSVRDEVMRLRGEVRRLEVDLGNTRTEALLAMAAERERCANVCREYAAQAAITAFQRHTAGQLAAAIEGPNAGAKLETTAAPK
jgi:hypothetical protein